MKNLQFNTFLSTPSARRATVPAAASCECFIISIHALREEGDLFLPVLPVTDFPISIHALREEGDQTANTHKFHAIIFLSTPSARRATLFVAASGAEY